jgi:hypothetical protein
MDLAGGEAAFPPAVANDRLTIRCPVSDRALPATYRWIYRILLEKRSGERGQQSARGAQPFKDPSAPSP